jgi:hypothetical protein
MHLVTFEVYIVFEIMRSPALLAKRPHVLLKTSPLKRLDGKGIKSMYMRSSNLARCSSEKRELRN